MFFFFPIGFLKEFHRIPWVNAGLILACVLTFVGQIAFGDTVEDWLKPYPTTTPPAQLANDELFGELAKETFREHVWYKQPWSLLTGALLHGGFGHLFGNMVFLFIFGCALNSDLGHARYALFVLVAALTTATVDLFVYAVPGIGASGVVCAVMGCVAALYPRNEIQYWYIYWFILLFGVGTLEFEAFWLIFLWLALDIVSQTLLGAAATTAYAAHIVGYLFGFLAGIWFLKVGWIASDGNDFLTWYLGAKVKKRKRQRFEPAMPVRTLVQLGPPAPTPDFDPIPLIADDELASPRRIVSEEDYAKRNALPVYKRLTGFFEEYRGESIDKEQVRELVEWYREYRRIHAGAKIAPTALFGMARLLAKCKENELALDAYGRLLEAIGEGKKGAVALEAARFAMHANEKAEAARLARFALECELSDDRRQKAQALLDAIED